MSSRLAKKIHPFILTKSRDIYPYLASKDSLDSTESLREEHGGTGSSTPSASTLKKKMGSPRNINFDDGTKAALMEEWANLRMSQGTLLSTMNASKDTTTHLHSNRGSQEPCNEAQIPSGEVAEPDNPHPTPTNDHIKHPSCSLSNQVVEPLPDSDAPATNELLFTPPLPLGEEFTLHNSLSDCDLRYPSSSPENVHAAIEGTAPSQYVNEGTTETIAQASHTPVIDSLEVVDQPLQLLATDSKTVTLHPPSSPILSKLDILPETTISAGPAASVKPAESSGRASPVDIQLVVSPQADIDDIVLGFHMLDLHEVLSPWVPMSPAAPSVYVPPAVQHLIAGASRWKKWLIDYRGNGDQIREQDASPSQQPPSLHASPRAASTHASPEEAGQWDGGPKPTSTDTTYPDVTTEDSCA
ncbi:uncharacterized protein F5891DRAFT_1073481 [Suillus fuscotomentosus]|uniref:Uncharacterized protein n=1 Tax=Suillus fuscotomentosus TaxID=1912939 RepID=A0AAD4HBX6_9AGAM|nr:uncharacterized protein F5891DRAFT_1073481 [Suillus fuscotomentosus]KAG1889645.1 hypothetical protein F5891DRAFT_1073481 [Suillus fuscotomentosus]